MGSPNLWPFRPSEFKMELLTVLTNFSPDPPPPIPRMVTDENVDILKTTGFAEASTLHIIITAWGGWWGGGWGGGVRRVRDLLQHERQNGAFSGPSLKWERKALLIRIRKREGERGAGERREGGGGGGVGVGGRHQDKGAKREHSYCMHVGIINRVDAIMSQEYYRKGGRGEGEEGASESLQIGKQAEHNNKQNGMC